MTKGNLWSCFIDNNPEFDEYEGIPVKTFADFVKEYHGEMVVISSRLYHKDMYRQLMENGIPDKRIINAGQILDEWSRKQYFDLEELKPEIEEIFVDAGSFDGMSSVEFAKWSLESKSRFIYAFEPDCKNMEKCRKNLSLHGIESRIINKGCWNEETVLHFQAQGNGNSMIDSSGEETVKVTRIDNEVSGKNVTFIKMDIEGAEMKALQGAKNTIIRNKPKLAVCVYHKPEDIWEIPQIIMQYCPEYRFYLRHYSLTDSETVLYAV